MRGIVVVEQGRRRRGADELAGVVEGLGHDERAAAAGAAVAVLGEQGVGGALAELAEQELVAVAEGGADVFDALIGGCEDGV
jgi:hypothetical protein